MTENPPQLKDKILSIIKESSKPLTTHDIWFKLYHPGTCRPEMSNVQMELVKMVEAGQVKYKTHAGTWNHINE